MCNLQLCVIWHSISFFFFFSFVIAIKEYLLPKPLQEFYFEVGFYLCAAASTSGLDGGYTAVIFLRLCMSRLITLKVKCQETWCFIQKQS